MEAGDWLRIRVQGFTFMGKLIDENNTFYAIEPLVLVLQKKDIEHMEELPHDTKKDAALRTVSVGRESYLGKTKAFTVESLKLLEED